MANWLASDAVVAFTRTCREADGLSAPDLSENCSDYMVM
jgi:hypothetical protein